MKNTPHKKRIGLFGGSFDPFHKGHHQAVHICLDQLQLDEIYIIPSFQTPGKPPTKIHPADRLTMLKQAFKHQPQVQVLDIEMKRKKTSYTIDTLNELNLNCDLFFLLGEDIFLQFHNWKDFEKILQKVHLAVLIREKKKIKESQILKKLDPFIQDYKKTAWHLKNGRQIIFIQLNSIYNQISSTQIRNKIRLGQSIKKEVLPELHTRIQNCCKHLEKITSRRLEQDISQFLQKKGALNPQVFYFNQDVCEYMLAASGLNTRHVRSLFVSLTSHIQKIYGISPIYVEGERLAQWIVMDYGFLIIHIFYDSLRKHYQLEQLWQKKAKAQ